MVPDLPSTWNVNGIYEVSFVVGFSYLVVSFSLPIVG